MLLRRLLARAAVLPQALVEVLVEVSARARESCRQRSRARVVRYFPRRQYWCSMRRWNSSRLQARLGSSVSLLLARFAQARSLHAERLRPTA
jgi:hypothetical protein